MTALPEGLIPGRQQLNELSGVSQMIAG